MAPYPTLISGNSFRGVLRIALESGFGGECASIPEALHALSVGFPKGRLISECPFDVLDFPKKQRKIWQITALEPKKLSNHKIKKYYIDFVTNCM